MTQPSRLATRTLSDNNLTTNQRLQAMITTEKLNAILQYKTDAKSRNFVARLAAHAKAREHALLDDNKQLKPQYESALTAVVALCDQGKPIDVAINTALNLITEPGKTAQDHYRDLKQ